MSLLTRLFRRRQKPAGGSSGGGLADELVRRVDELVQEQARLGREQSRAITLLEGHGTSLEEMGAVWGEQLAQRRQDAARLEQALGRLQDSFVLGTVQELLPVADALRHTLDAAPRVRHGSGAPAEAPQEESLDRGDLAAWVEGASLAEQRLLAVLARLGARRIPTIGHQFDPHLHLALAAIEDDRAGNGQIVAEDLAGYTLRDRVLRHAEVIVARNGSPSAATACAGVPCIRSYQGPSGVKEEGP